MDRPRPGTLASIQHYATTLNEARQLQMDVEASGHAAFEARLKQTLHELQERVEQQQRALAELRASTRQPAPLVPSADPRERLRQLRTLQNAYERLTPAEPYLPGPTSVLPTLLATDSTQRCISETRDALAISRAKLGAARRELDREERGLQDANAITLSLEARIDVLDSQRQERAAKAPPQLAKELLASMRKRQQKYDVECRRLQSALESFVEEHLAALVAAEELGGPVVGELMDVGDEMLAAGFSHQGKPKPLKQGMAAVDRRQRRIDEIWGATGAPDDEPLDEKDAAATEIRSLVEDLLRALLGETPGGEYVELNRDSAASRFLVRAKVAQFHPKDARKLRLVDFGRDLDM
ncbi:uncharacterized protein BKCO1_2100014 [Diplodia corticola]|uniref:Chromosome segregation protein n=1 Tax=Diplodia corticola TaxID=236234 RepID=A0A1J9RQ09_9PEZI|nr:uncharacterized protein BKCO1_2100014 [Diplodia corticola]OJD34651.1 hypothetical protein BKCO1_2100014 [Diplodia corticola]